MLFHYIGKFFSNVNTMVHEDGHALMALIVGKGVNRIELYRNTEGVANTLSSPGIKGWLPRILISLAGYPTSSPFMWVYYYFLTQEKYEILFYSLGVLIVINLIFLVRNFYGIVWLVLLLCVLGGIYYLDDPLLMSYSMMFIGAILFVESIYSALEILILSFKTPNDAGDATSLKRSTMVSSRVWGGIFLAQALFFGYLVIGMI
jgi:hypothetical protein